MAEKSFKYVIVGGGVSAVSADPLIILFMLSLALFFIYVWFDLSIQKFYQR